MKMSKDIRNKRALLLLYATETFIDPFCDDNDIKNMRISDMIKLFDKFVLDVAQHNYDANE